MKSLPRFVSKVLLIGVICSTVVLAAAYYVTAVAVGAQTGTVNEGTPGSVTFTITLTEGGNGNPAGGTSNLTILWGVGGTPSGITVSGLGAITLTGTGQTVTMTINTDATTAQGSYDFTISSDNHAATSSAQYFTVDAPLPVELTSFTCYANGNVVTLNWATATEVNNYGFEVYRDGAKVGFVQGHGNSNSPKSYSFTDKPVGAKTFSYQLKQVDFSGLSKMYGPVMVTVDVPAAFVLHQNYPNPYNPSTTIKYEVPFTDKITMKVYNLIGQEIATLFDGVRLAGTYEVKFDGSNLASGIYIYSLVSSSFTKNIKMLLMK